MLGDRLAERLALVRVADGLLERRPGHPDAARGDVDPAELDRGHELLESLATPASPPSTLDAGVAEPSNMSSVDSMPMYPIFFSRGGIVRPGCS